jgi:uncharacterized membrane protein YjjP (DUF1212 family)/uncharacterized membrane protein YjjB (DUF3815 family)
VEVGEVQPDLPDVRRILAMARRAGVLLLASGAQTNEVEDAVRHLTADLGLEDVQVGVFFSSIQLSYVAPGDLEPTTVLQLSSGRTADLTRLSDVTSLIHRVASGDLDLDGAELEMTQIEHNVRLGSVLLAIVAPAISSAALALLFGGAPLDVVATFLLSLLILPSVAWLKRSGMPPFFSLLLGAAAATILAAITYWVGFHVEAGLLMTACLLQFLPGAALVAGARDLIDQSVISGTARLAEALLIGAGVASGAALGIAISPRLGVVLAFDITGPRTWAPPVVLAAAAIAVAAYSLQLAVPRFAVPWTALLGAMAWTIYSLLGYGPEAGTFLAAAVVGGAGRLLARHYRAPATLWVVPSTLTLLPGLALVIALLAPVDAERFAGLWHAVLIAFLLGVGVAAGDIAVTTVFRLRHRVVEPAVEAVTSGIGALVIGPLARLTTRAEKAPVEDVVNAPDREGPR